jgi:ribokinase
MKVNSVEDAGLAAEILQRRGAGAVIVTLGEKGSLVLDRNGAHTFVPAYKVDVVDTTGAGDSYNGAFAVAIAEGRDLISAASFASAAAAISVTRIGTAPAMPFRSEIEELLRAAGG